MESDWNSYSEYVNDPEKNILSVFQMEELC